jgi:hypothetical protein
MKRGVTQGDTGILSSGKLYSVGNARLERGRYLVQQVGLCADCHTPRDDRGQPVEEKDLQGARILFKPIVPMPAWGESAPHIAGLVAFTDEQAIELLTTGKDPSGKFAARPCRPMGLAGKMRRPSSPVFAALRPKDEASSDALSQCRLRTGALERLSSQSTT